MTDVSEISKAEMDKVIARAQKLLAKTKTDRGNSEAEAETALKQVQALLSKYNLDMAQIEAASSTKENAVTRVKEEMKGRAMYKWQRTLAKYVAEANFCYHLIKNDAVWVPTHWSDEDPSAEGVGKWSRFGYGDAIPEGIKLVEGRYKTTPKHLFVGRQANVITAQLMYKYLTQTIEDLLPIKDNALRLSRSAMSWKEGCADRLCERLASKRKDLMEEHDANVRAEEARIKADAEAQLANKAKQLPPNKGAEIKAAMSGLASEAFDATGMKDEPEEQERPEVNESDTWSPTDVEKAPEGTTSTAMVLASVYDEKEREANWEAAHGYAPGTLARMRAESEERRKAAAAEEAKQEVGRVEAPVKDETERQKQARLRREEEEQARLRRKWDRRDAAERRREEREWAKKDHTMYKAGAEIGKGIGIDVQVGAATDAKLLKGRE